MLFLLLVGKAQTLLEAVGEVGISDCNTGSDFVAGSPIAVIKTSIMIPERAEANKRDVAGVAC